MKISRRQFVGSLLIGGTLGSAGLGRAGDAASARGAPGKRASIEHAFIGYPVSMASGVPRAAWSAAPGETVHFALSADNRIKPHLYMQSISGEQVHAFGETTINSQDFLTDTPWLDGAGYVPTISWTIPDNLESGAYFLNGLADVFVNVRATALAANRRLPHSLKTAVLLPTNTVNAYSTTLERSTYAHPVRVPVVSFLRPFNATHGQSWQGTVKWLSEEPLFGQPRFLIDQDLERHDVLQGVELLVIAGHSEYWTRRAREVFDAFIARGGHAIVASGNAMWWQVRYEDDGQRMVSYKGYDPAFGVDPEPDPLLVTRSWLGNALGMPIANSIGGDFERGGFGSHRKGLNVQGTGLRVADADHPLFAGLELRACDNLDFGGVREYDGAPILGLDARGRPVADRAGLGAHRLEILAYEWTKRGGAITLATAHIFQARPAGGVVLHLGAPEASNGLAAGCKVMRQVCHEYVRRILSGESLFSNRPAAEVAFAIHTPWKKTVPLMKDWCGDVPSV